MKQGEINEGALQALELKIASICGKQLPSGERRAEQAQQD